MNYYTDILITNLLKSKVKELKKDTTYVLITPYMNKNSLDTIHNPSKKVSPLKLLMFLKI